MSKIPFSRIGGSRRLRQLALFCLTLSVMTVFPVSSVVGDDASGRQSGASEGVAPRTTEEQQIIDVYKRANKAVVYVSTRMDVVDFFGVHSQEGSGSGVVIDVKKGYVITNFHVVEKAAQVIVTMHNGQSYPVSLVGQDEGSDLALLQLKEIPEDLVAVSLGDSDILEVGQRVLAIGNPFGLARTLSAGIVSSLGRTIKAPDGRLIEDVIQIDASINPGNSGGPLLDTLGRVVGLNTAILSTSGDSAGIGFAVPVNTISKAIPQFIKYGRVLRPKIGVIVEDTNYGPILYYVDPDGPAARAGLVGARRLVRQGVIIGYITEYQKADFILAINGKQVVSKADILEAISRGEQGKALSITVRRGLSRKEAPRVVLVEPELN